MRRCYASLRRLSAKIRAFLRHPSPGTVAAGDLVMTGVMVAFMNPAQPVTMVLYLCLSALLLAWCAIKTVAFTNTALVGAA